LAVEDGLDVFSIVVIFRPTSTTLDLWGSAK